MCRFISADLVAKWDTVLLPNGKTCLNVSIRVGPGRGASETGAGLACACTGFVAMVTAPHSHTKNELQTSTHSHVCEANKDSLSNGFFLFVVLWLESDLREQFTGKSNFTYFLVTLM